MPTPPPSDDSVKRFILDSLAGRGKLCWDEFAIEIDAAYRKVGEPLAASQYERCYWELADAKQIRHINNFQGWHGMWGVAEIVPANVPAVSPAQLSLFQQQ